MSKKDFYEILGVSKTATQEEIKKAYKEKVILLHPDKHSDKSEEERLKFEDEFKLVAESYSTLSDPEKRKQYDLTGSSSSFNYNNYHDHDIDEFLKRWVKNTHFGFGGFQNMDMGFSTKETEFKGGDINLKISVTIDELYNGCTKKFKYKVNKPCTNCDGGKKEKCPVCNGLGMVTKQISGWSVVRTTCSACGGSGEILTKTSCNTCGGTGLVNTEETISVVIEPGLTVGNGVVMKGKGHSLPKGVKGVAGDLNIIIANVTNSIFNIRGNDLYIEKEIPIVDILLGSEIEIPSLNKEKLKVKIPSNTLNGSSFRLLNKGLPLYGSKGFGNLYVTVKHKFPSKELDSSDKKILEKLKKSNNFK